MTERFVGSDPLSPRDEKRLKDHVKKTIAPHLERIGKAKLDHVVGASGTILALGRLAYEVETGQKPESLHHVTLDAGSFRTVKERLLKTDLEDRMKMPGLDKRRVDIIVAGAVVLDTLLKRMNVRKLLLSEWALREGLLLDYISRHRATLVRAGAHPDVRRRSVLEFAERYLHDDPHARHVAHLALALFDGTGRIHGLDKRQRTLLEYSALLHGVGHHISHSQHHLHTYYLIKHGDLRGFDPLEIEIMANVARYHRRGRPRKKHDAYAALPASQRRAVRVLAGLLQLADALDRSHRQRIRSLRVVKSAGGLKVRCTAEGNVDLEKWGAGRRTDLLERALDTKILIEMVRPGKRPAGKGEAE